MVLKITGRDFLHLSTGLSPSMVVLSMNIEPEKSFVTLRQLLGAVPRVLQPSSGIGPNAVRPLKFRLFPFRSPLLRESHSISFPQDTKMFQFSWFPLANASARGLPRQVALLGNPRLGLLDSSPRLFAVMPRPSSATDTKASALCPFLFDLLQLEHKT